MMTITRRQARSLRGVFRRSTLGIAHRGPLPPLTLIADGDKIRVRYGSAYLAVELVVPAAGPSAGSVPLPLDALADLEGRDDAPIALDPVAPDRTVARWADRGIPQAREYPIPARPQPGAFPALPAEWSDAPAGLLDALAEATATTTAGSTRYALDCLLLRGDPAGGELVATDGRQALIRRGLGFPWDGDVLVPGSPVFACRDLPRDRPWQVGRTDTHVVLRCDSTLIALTIRVDARFPRVDEVFPDPGAATARLRLDPADAAFLTASLGRLPGAADPLAPVTVDLNGHVAVRARGGADAAATELVLARSDYSGTPTRFSCDRGPLGRALRLGFAEVEVGEPDGPIVCRSGPLAYAWQPLHVDSIVPADAVATRVESHASELPTPAVAPTPTPTPMPIAATSISPTTMSITSMPITPASIAPTPAMVTPVLGVTADAVASAPTPTACAVASAPLPETAGANDRAAAGRAHSSPPAEDADLTSPDLAALVREAEAIRDELGVARTRCQRLVVALRRHRKQARATAATLRALRQLQLQDVAG